MKEDNWVWTHLDYRTLRVHLPLLPPLTKALAWRILIFDHWRVEVLIRPRRAKGHPHPVLFTMHLAAADTSFRKEPGGGGLFWAMGRYHDLSRHCCLLPRCCQGDAMNFDLKRSWLGATVVQQGRVDFSIWVLRGCTEVGSWI